MPTFVSHISIDLHELLQDGAIASCTFCCKSRRVVKMTIDVPLVLIVRVLRAKQCRTRRTSEMIDVKFLIWSNIKRISIKFKCEISILTAGSDVAASESRITLGTYEVQPAEVVSFAKRVLFAFSAFDREKLLCYNLTTVLQWHEARIMEDEELKHVPCI